MVVGGTFTTVTPVGGSATSRSYVMAFDTASGALVPGFNPSLNGIVNEVIPGPTAGTVYLAGAFTTVNGAAQSHVTLVSTSTGAVVNGFRPASTNGLVNTLVQRGNRLFVGGNFTTAGGRGPRGAGLDERDDRRPGRLREQPGRPAAQRHRVGGPGRRRRARHGPQRRRHPAGRHRQLQAGRRSLPRPGRPAHPGRHDVDGHRRLADQPLLAVLLQLGLRHLRPRRQLLPGRLLLRGRGHRWLRGQHALRRRRPVRDQRQLARRAARPGSTTAVATPCGASPSPRRRSTSAATSGG